MSSATMTDHASAETRAEAEEIRYEAWKHWPVNWSAAWVGALSAFGLVLLFGLVGIAVGAHKLGVDDRVVELKKFGLQTIALCITGSFFSFVVGGWVAGKIAGIYHAEPGMLYGAVAWLLAIPLLVAAAGLGASSMMGGWYGGLSGAAYSTSGERAPFSRPEALPPNPTPEEVTTYRSERDEYRSAVEKWRFDAPKVARNSALGAAAALLLGLIGSVLGGWMASGEPMSLTHHRTRKPRYYPA